MRSNLKKKSILCALAAVGLTNVARAGIVSDGDFSSWTVTGLPGSAQFSAGGHATGSRQASGGNPGAFLDTDMTFPAGYSPDAAHSSYVFGIKGDYSTTANINGDSWSMTEDYSPESASAYNQVGLAVQQGSSLFYYSGLTANGISTWQSLTSSGSFAAGAFTRITGTDTLNFNGGVPTYFGTYAYNDTSFADIHMGFENWSLDSVHLVAVPEPGVSLLVMGLAGVAMLRRRLPISSDGTPTAPL